MKRMMGLTMHGRQSPETNHVLSSSNNLSTSSMPQRQRRKLSPKRTCPTLLMNDRLIMGMAMVWMAVILYGESLSFSSAAARCGSLSNPHYMLRPPTTKAKILGEVTRIALISDPQLTSPYSYDWMKGRPFVTRIVEFFSDIYMRRAYQAIQTLQQPEVVFFTGDLFDGVTYNLYREKRSEFDTDEYKRLLDRWNWVFASYSETAGPSWVFNVSGNHDIGFEIDKLLPGTQEHLIGLFEKNFGELNYAIKIGEVEWLWQHQGMTQLQWRSMQQPNGSLLTADVNMQPGQVLISHVPLWRPRSAVCAEDAETGTKNSFPEHSGYRTMLRRETTEHLLRSVRPNYVFSGDAHVNCAYNHSQNGRISEERTLNTFSWLQGQRNPSYAFVTQEPKSTSLNIVICPLPDQIGIYLFYAALFGVTCVVGLFARPAPASGIVITTEAKDILPHSFRTIHTNENYDDDDDDLKPIRAPGLLVRLRTMVSFVCVLVCHVIPWWLLLVWISM